MQSNTDTDDINRIHFGRINRKYILKYLSISFSAFVIIMLIAILHFGLAPVLHALAVISMLMIPVIAIFIVTIAYSVLFLLYGNDHG